VARLCAGDQAAMGQLYELYSRPVYCVALRILGDNALAEQVLEIVFLDFWRHPCKFETNHGSLAALLFIDARRRACHLRPRQVA
jgi:RNA polymerase sigma-70 factor, ECF subfamily